MSLVLFGVTNDTVRRHLFPQWPSFNTKSNPTSASVDELIIQEAASLAGALAKRSVLTSSFDITNTPIAWNWAAATLEYMVGIRIAPAVTGLDSALVNRWSKEKTVRLADLEAKGATVLVDVLATESAETPMEASSHIDQFNLATADSTTGQSQTTASPLHWDDEM